MLLARHFVTLFARSMNPKVRGLGPDAAEAIDAHGWPGNVRELENRIKRAVIMADGRSVSAADLDALQSIAEATNAAAYDASTPKTITKVFTAVVSTF